MVPDKLLAGKYKILEEIGRGGMGVVYRAEDKGLARRVAIKVLPDVFSRDPERLARFEREAKVLASLNHPQIAGIYGLEESDGKRFLILEFVEGETLAERLSRGSLSLEETLDVCLQIAEGLEGAHEKGFIHRDLKPSNVKVTPEGKVKILDFGLARAYHDQIAEVDIIKSPTITADMTQPGVILGTAPYMSPEQAKGKAVDKRSDIWAFGCVLYECLTGKRAFKGETVTETLAAILKSEPDWEALPAAMPYKMRDLLRRCLKKDARERLHDIADARIEIAEAISQPLVTDFAPAGKVRGIRKAITLILGVCVIGLAATIFALLRKMPPPVPIVRAAIDLPLGMQLTRDKNGPTRTELDLSPDGKYIVFSASADGTESKARLYLHAIERDMAEPIPGTEGARAPFFSPDGRWLAFWAHGKLQKVLLSGGLPIPLCDCRAIPMGASWGPDARIIVGTELGGLQSVSAAGGKLETLTTLDPTKEATHRLPQFLPGGKAVLFTVMPFYLGAQARIEALQLDSGKRIVLIEDGADARFVPTGHLVFLQEGKLMAAPFDPDRLELKSPSVPVVEGVMQAINESDSTRNSGAGQFSFSTSGSLAYAPGGIFPDGEGQLVWVDRQGKAEPMAAFGKKPILNIRLSPDGRKLAYTAVGKKAIVWVYDLVRGVPTPLTAEGRAGYCNWTPDGTRVVFRFSKAGVQNIFQIPWDGSGSMEKLTTSDNNQHPGSWSPDGRFLAFVENGPISRDILYLRMSDRTTVPFLNSEHEEAFPEFSPDGRWLAYSSTESGRWEVRVTRFPDRAKTFTISNEGGQAPLWARSGRELFFWNLDRTKLMIVDTVIQPEFRAGAPRLLFEFPAVVGMMPLRSYDIMPDGRFLIPASYETKPVEAVRLNIVLNWLEELKRLCPTGKK